MLPYKRFLLVRDNFYNDPEEVRRIAKSLSYDSQDDATGLVSSDVYYPRDTRRRLQRIFGVRITRWDDDPSEGNGIFYLGFAKGELAEVPGVHYDEPTSDITAIVYLTPGLPADCGTSLWRHRATGIEDAPRSADARRLGCSLAALRDRLERDSNYRRRWIEIDRAGYAYNRMVAYPSGALHSATRHYGGSVRGGRIYQTFRLGVDWTHSRIHS